MQSIVMFGVRVKMMERRPLEAVGRKTTNQIRDIIYLYIYIYILRVQMQKPLNAV